MTLTIFREEIHGATNLIPSSIHLSLGETLFLCGSPLLNQCKENETSRDSQSVVDEEESNDDLLMHLFYINMVFGFIVGFWAVCGILIFKRSWRIAYFQFFDDMGDLFYVKVARYVAKLQKTRNELVGNEGQ